MSLFQHNWKILHYEEANELPSKFATRTQPQVSVLFFSLQVFVVFIQCLVFCFALPIAITSVKKFRWMTLKLFPKTGSEDSRQR